MLVPPRATTTEMPPEQVLDSVKAEQASLYLYVVLATLVVYDARKCSSNELFSHTEKEESVPLTKRSGISG